MELSIKLEIWILKIDLRLQGVRLFFKHHYFVFSRQDNFQIV